MAARHFSAAGDGYFLSANGYEKKNRKIRLGPEHKKARDPDWDIYIAAQMWYIDK